MCRNALLPLGFARFADPSFGHINPPMVTCIVHPMRRVGTGMQSKARQFVGSRLIPRLFVVGAVLCAPFLSGCSTHIGDMQTPIALPAGAPERPATPIAYPAVH